MFGCKAATLASLAYLLECVAELAFKLSSVIRDCLVKFLETTDMCCQLGANQAPDCRHLGYKKASTKRQ